MLFLVAGQSSWAQDRATSKAPLEREYQKTIRPLLERYCFGCHGEEKPKGGINFEKLVSWTDLVGAYKLLKEGRFLLEDGEMPLEKADQPTEAERDRMISWIDAFLDHLATTRSGDPGLVALRRLTEVEYQHTIRDLTGSHFDLSDQLPPDASGGEGFANVGSVQMMSDAVLEKYLAAAKEVLTHARVSPVLGITFEETETPGHDARARAAMIRIQEIYDAEYERFRFIEVDRRNNEIGSLLYHRKALLACWQRRHARTLGINPNEVALAHGLPQPVVDDLWRALTTDWPANDVRRSLVSRWMQLPGPIGGSPPDDLENRITTLLQEVERWRESVLETKRNSLTGIDPKWYFDNPPESITRHFLIHNLLPSEEPVEVNLEGYLKTTTRKSFSLADLAVLPEPLPKPPQVKDDKKQKPEPQTTPSYHLPLRIPIKIPAHTEYLQLKLKLTDQKTKRPIFVQAVLIDAEGSETPQTIALETRAIYTSAAYDGMVEAVTPLLELLPDFTNEAMQAGPMTRLLLNIGQGEKGFLRFNPSATDFPYPRHDKLFLRHLPHHREALDQAWQELAYRHPQPYFNRRQLTAELLRRAASKNRDSRITTALPLLFTAYVLEEQQLATLTKSYERVPKNVSSDFLHFVTHFLDRKQRARLRKTLLDPSSELGSKATITEADRRQAETFAKEIERFESHLDQKAGPLILDFAEQAYRRPLINEHRDKLLSLYHRLRGEGESFPDAIRVVVLRCLVSPHFLYHWQDTGKEEVEPLGPWELVNRLSYFLWTSPPDEELRQAAANGSILEDKVLTAQTARMLADERAGDFANEFFGSWFEYRDFLNANGPDSSAYPEFDDDLQKAMSEEVRLFFSDLVRKDRSIDSVLDAEHAFYNGRLEVHYGRPTQTPLIRPGQPEQVLAGDGWEWRGEPGSPVLSIDGKSKHNRGYYRSKLAKPAKLEVNDSLSLRIRVVGDDPLQFVEIRCYEGSQIIAHQRYQPAPSPEGRKEGELQKVLRDYRNKGIILLPPDLSKWITLKVDPARLGIVNQLFSAVEIAVGNTPVEVDGFCLDRSGRGFRRHLLIENDPRRGLLGMGAILTMLSTPSRTSPVKRGAWILDRVIDQSTPPPPPMVPNLPPVMVDGDSQRELLKAHRENPNCAACHDRIDPLGLALESFDLMGRWRTKEINGQAIDARGAMPDGRVLNGVHELRAYVLEHRASFRALFCHKLLGFALGREVLPSDRALLQKMARHLEKRDGRISFAVDAVVQSSQFRQRRNRPATANE